MKRTSDAFAIGAITVFYVAAAAVAVIYCSILVGIHLAAKWRSGKPALIPAPAITTLKNLGLAGPTPPSIGVYRVQATREGLIGGRTATGHIIRRNDLFVALPDRSALKRAVVVTYKGRSFIVPVLDVGPHNVNDPYWARSGVPAAAKGLRIPPMSRYGRPKNKAGVDLSDALWDKLGIPRRQGIATVEWRFVN